ncbi:MAG: signal peptidase I [Desulfobacterales bacterium]|nr:signal peptidase I [Desulfobacterales bacterium]
MDKKWKKRLLLFYRGWGFSLLIAILIATSFKSAIADWNDIPSGSMKPTILIGDRIFVNKLAYDLKLPYTTLHLAQWADPVRGDIVVFFSPHDGKRMVKRVVGLPGDTIAMFKNRLFINGVAINYKPLKNEVVSQISPAQRQNHFYFSENLSGKKHPVMFESSQPSLNSFGPVAVPKGNYFMLGDNRDNSADSRFFGFVDRKLIVGRASAVVISRDKSFFHPRWKRFFQTLM